MAAERASTGIVLGLAVLVVALWLILALLAARDVKRRGGPAVWTFVFAFVFWPVGLYLWARQRGRSDAPW